MPRKHLCAICGCDGSKVPEHLSIEEIRIIMTRFRLVVKNLVEPAGVGHTYVSSLLRMEIKNEKIQNKIEKYLIAIIKDKYEQSQR